MFHRQNFFTLLSLSVVVVSIFAADEIAEKKKEWKKVNGSLNSMRIFNLKPSKTLELLKRLLELEEFGNWEESGMIENKETCETLIAISQIEMANCDSDYFEVVDELLEKFRLDTSTIEPYLLYYRLEQFKMCLPKFTDTLKKGIASLSDETKEKVSSFINLILKRKPNEAFKRVKLPLAVDEVSRGVVEFIELESGQTFELSYELFDKETGPLLFAINYNNTINGVCEEIYKILFNSMEDFYEFPLELVDDFTYEWLLKARTCSDLYTEHDFMAAQSHHALLKKYGKIDWI